VIELSRLPNCDRTPALPIVGFLSNTIGLPGAPAFDQHYAGYDAALTGGAEPIEVIRETSVHNFSRTLIIGLIEVDACKAS
jgi:hypothetical protein